MSHQPTSTPSHPDLDSSKTSHTDQGNDTDDRSNNVISQEQTSSTDPTPVTSSSTNTRDPAASSSESSSTPAPTASKPNRPPSFRGSPNMKPLKWLFGMAVMQTAAASSWADIVDLDVVDDTQSSVKPLVPSLDPWYRAPSGWEDKEPGDVLRVRLAPGNLTSVVGSPIATLNILYRTQDSRSRPSWAVTTLFIPPKFKISPSGKASLLSYQFAYNSCNLDSAPSIGLYWRLAQEDPHLGLKSDTGFINDMLLMGYIVNTPDYWGPDAAFGASKQAGHATLDAIRAILWLGKLTGNTDINTVLWGYSGGTIATGSAIELQPSYAPDVKFAGAAMGGYADDISSSLRFLNRSPIAGTMFSLLLGITAQFPEAREYIVSRVKPELREEFLAILDLNQSDVVVKYSGQDVLSFFINGESDLYGDIMQDLYEQQARVGLGDIPQTSMFFYKAINDEFCEVALTDTLVQKYCAAHADVRYDRNTIGGHVAEIENGKPRAWEWIKGIFSEEHHPSKCCRVRDVTIEVDPTEELRR